MLARPDSARYRLSKFVRRHAIAVTVATVVVASLAAFGAVSARQARVLAEQRHVAQVERDKAEQVVRVLIDLFQTINPSVRPDGDRMPVGDFLAGAQGRSLELLRSTPAVRARLQQVFGLIQQTRGQYVEARRSSMPRDRAAAATRAPIIPDARVDAGARRAGGGCGENERARTLLEESLRRQPSLRRSARAHGDAFCTPRACRRDRRRSTRARRLLMRRGSRFNETGCGRTIPWCGRAVRVGSAATTRGRTPR